MGRGKPPVSLNITVNEFGRYFHVKVAGASLCQYHRYYTLPSYEDCPAGVNMDQFAAVTTDDVINCIRRLPDKTSAADPLPTCWLKRMAVKVAPYLSAVFSRSLVGGRFPNAFKQAFITPILKKTGLDPDDVRSYRPISNSSVIS